MPLVARLAALAPDAAAEPAASPQVEPAAGADAVAPTEPDRDTGAGVLARARTLLDQSRAVREDVAALRARLAPLPAAIAPTAGAGGT
ncbi:MAG: hypothetical protein H5U20_02270 [Rhodobacteraceae bacterium]|nr:hypothetical protein [Paracoccaceae bacterium]